MLKNAMQQYCVTNSTPENDVPADVDDFCQLYRVQFEYVNRKTFDSDRKGGDVGLKMYCIGFYTTGTVGDVKNFLMFLDDVFHFRLSFSSETLQPIPKLPDIVVGTPEAYGLQINGTEDDTKCSFSVKEGYTDNASMFDLSPPIYPGHHLVLTVEPTSRTKAHLIFSGNTKPFQEAFVGAQFKLTHFQKEGNVYKDYYRVLESADLSKETTVQSLSTFCGCGIFVGSHTPQV